MRVLSTILRHSAIQRGLKVDDGGWVTVEALFRLKEFKSCTLQRLKAIVCHDPKHRFSLKTTRAGCRSPSDEAKWVIRANQGHTFVAGIISSPKLCTQLTLADLPRYPYVVHGTTLQAWSSIKVAGLHRMGRQHIHFASSQHARSGIRASAEVLIQLDLKAVLEHQIPIYVSSNGVVLCAGEGKTNCLSPTFFLSACMSHSKKPLPFGKRWHGASLLVPNASRGCAGVCAAAAPTPPQAALTAAGAAFLSADSRRSSIATPEQPVQQPQQHHRLATAGRKLGPATATTESTPSIWATTAAAKRSSSSSSSHQKKFKRLDGSAAGRTIRKNHPKSNQVVCAHPACRTAPPFESRVHLHVHRITHGSGHGGK